MKNVMLPLFISFVFNVLNAQTSILLTSQRPPILEVSQYKMVAIGDISGPLGTKTELSLDLTDALSSRLFSAQTLELVDKATFDKILGEQKFKDLQVIDAKTTQEINKKLGTAIMLTGRLQSDKIEQKLIYDDQAIVVNGCSRKYYYQVSGSVSIQLKIFDLKTGKLIYNDAIIRKVEKRTKEDCSVPSSKLDIGEITRQATKDLSEDVASLIVPFEVKTMLNFVDPGLLKSPFKKLREAIALLKLNNTQEALAILKGYTEDKAIKARHQAPAFYNYGLGLLYAGNLELSEKALQASVSANNTYLANVTELVDYIEKEKQANQKMARLSAEKKKQDELIAQGTSNSATPDKKEPGKKTPAAKTPVKKKSF